MLTFNSCILLTATWSATMQAGNIAVFYGDTKYFCIVDSDK